MPETDQEQQTGGTVPETSCFSSIRSKTKCRSRWLASATAWGAHNCTVARSRLWGKVLIVCRAQLSLLHPRLLQALILIDPVIQTENPSRSFAKPSTYRRDIWPSRQEAKAKLASSKFYQAWDPRVFEKWVQFGLRDLPTELYPNRSDGAEPPVTLTTPKSQEVFSYLRPKYHGNPGIAPEMDRVVYGDMHPDDIEEGYPFYRPEPAQIFRRLPELKPPVLYIFGKHSELATPELRRKKMETTGIGVGGSGGYAEGKV